MPLKRGMEKCTKTKYEMEDEKKKAVEGEVYELKSDTKLSTNNASSFCVLGEDDHSTAIDGSLKNLPRQGQRVCCRCGGCSSS